MSVHHWLFGIALAAGSAACAAQGAWSPQRNIEIVVGSAPGGSNDKTARQVEKILVEQKLVPTSITVVNKSGAGGTLALNYLNQHAGDGHYVIVFTPSMLTNHITGQSKAYYKDFTPIASLFSDYIVFPVNASGSIKDGNDLVARLKKDPQSISVGFATALGSHNRAVVETTGTDEGAGGHKSRVYPRYVRRREHLNFLPARLDARSSSTRFSKRFHMRGMSGSSSEKEAWSPEVTMPGDDLVIQCVIVTA
jgi:tripartite-type tricarboxylate transporter receptor subunit TctC